MRVLVLVLVLLSAPWLDASRLSQRENIQRAATCGVAPTITGPTIAPDTISAPWMLNLRASYFGVAGVLISRRHAITHQLGALKDWKWVDYNGRAVDAKSQCKNGVMEMPSAIGHIGYLKGLTEAPIRSVTYLGRCDTADPYGILIVEFAEDVDLTPICLPDPREMHQTNLGVRDGHRLFIHHKDGLFQMVRRTMVTVRDCGYPIDESEEVCTTGGTIYQMYGAPVTRTDDVAGHAKLYGVTQTRWPDKPQNEIRHFHLGHFSDRICQITGVCAI